MSLSSAAATGVLPPDLAAPLVRALPARPGVVTLSAALATGLQGSALGSTVRALSRRADLHGERSVRVTHRKGESQPQSTSGQVRVGASKILLESHRLGELCGGDVCGKFCVHVHGLVHPFLFPSTSKY